jgi:hypothetical protein
MIFVRARLQYEIQLCKRCSSTKDLTDAESILIRTRMTGPSAMGSEYGTPSSIMSHPHVSSNLIASAVVSRFGSPAVRYGMSATCNMIKLSHIINSISSASKTQCSTRPRRWHPPVISWANSRFLFLGWGGGGGGNTHCKKERVSLVFFTSPDYLADLVSLCPEPNLLPFLASWG